MGMALPQTHVIDCLAHREWYYQEVQPCWRKCDTVWAGFEVSYVQAQPTVTHSPHSCLWKPDVEFSTPQHHFCLDTTMLPTDGIGLNL